MAKFYENIESWLDEHGGRIFRYLVFKKVYTPYEQQKAFSDASMYESNYYQFCKIEEIIILADDVLLGLRSMDRDGEVYPDVEYHKLSEIKLMSFDNDQDIEPYIVEVDDDSSLD